MSAVHELGAERARLAAVMEAMRAEPIKGLEVYFSQAEVVTLDEHVENIEGAIFDAHQAIATAIVFVAAGTAGNGPVVLSAEDVAALRQMLALVKSHTAIAREAAEAMALSRHAW